MTAPVIEDGGEAGDVVERDFDKAAHTVFTELGKYSVGVSALAERGHRKIIFKE